MRKRETEIQLTINVLVELSVMGGVKAHFLQVLLNHLENLANLIEILSWQKLI